MLLSFRVENHRSLRDEQALTLEPSLDERGTPRPALPVAALYGANASGKTNVLSALNFMRSTVLRSHRIFSPDGGVPRTPFAWPEKPALPSFFEITFVVDTVRYDYGFVADDQRFTEEWLHAFPTPRKQVWFERDGDDFKFGEFLKGENAVIGRLTRPNSLFLSAAAQNSHQQLGSIYRWFQSIRSHRVPMERFPSLRWRISDAEVFARWWSRSADGDRTSSDRADRFRKLLKATDVGIVDIEVREAEATGVDEPIPRSVRVKHEARAGEAWLPLEEESHGTRQLFRLGPEVIDALTRGSLVIIDELEASFHPLLAIHLINAFNDPKQNPHGAQLLFTTHDTNLLGNTLGPPPLQRDQVWLTEKDREGATRLYPLTDYKPRKAENLERGYLQGRYGAIPFLGRLVDPEPEE
jgi:predicted ATPase